MLSYLNEFQLEVLWHLVVLTNSKDVGDDVVGGIPLVPQGLEDLVRLVYLTAHTVTNHLFDQERVWLITNLSRITTFFILCT